MTTYQTYDPTALFAGDAPTRHRNVTIAKAAAILLRGTVLGRSAVASGPGAVSGSAGGSNTGNGTLTVDAVTPVLAYAKAGNYVVKFTAPTTFDVYDPDGRRLAPGVVGQGYADQVKFAVAAGSTAFAANDTFTLNVGAQDKYVPCIATATDGSQVPSAVVAADIDTTAADTVGPAYFDGTFAVEKLILDASWSPASLDAALRQANSQLFVKQLGSLG